MLIRRPAVENKGTEEPRVRCSSMLLLISGWPVQQLTLFSYYWLLLTSQHISIIAIHVTRAGIQQPTPNKGWWCPEPGSDPSLCVERKMLLMQGSFQIFQIFSSPIRENRHLKFGSNEGSKDWIKNALL